MNALREYPFEWVLPGHGERVKLPGSQMGKALVQLIEFMAGEA